MYYAKLSNAYTPGSGRAIDSDDVFPANSLGFDPKSQNLKLWCFCADPIVITSIQAGDGLTPTEELRLPARTTWFKRWDTN